MPDLHNEGALEAHTLQDPSAVQPPQANAAGTTPETEVMP